MTPINAFVSIILGVIAVTLVLLLVVQSIRWPSEIEVAIGEWPTPVPTHTPVPTRTPATTTAYRLGQHMDSQGTIDDTYQDSANADRFVESAFLYVVGELHVGRIPVPICRQLTGFPNTRYAIAVPDASTVSEFLIGGSNEIGGFVLQAGSLTIGGGSYKVYVSDELLDCQEYEGTTWTIR